MPDTDKKEHVLGNVAVYPGTFDPVTRGHLDLICRGSKLFDHLIVGVASAPLKKALFSLDERVEMICNSVPHLSNVEVEKFSGLTVDWVRTKHASVMLRGIRTVSDFEYEYQLALTNRTLAKDVETVFIMPGEQFSFISSTLVKNIVASGGNATDFVTQEVFERLRAKMRDLK